MIIMILGRSDSVIIVIWEDQITRDNCDWGDQVPCDNCGFGETKFPMITDFGEIRFHVIIVTLRLAGFLT